MIIDLNSLQGNCGDFNLELSPNEFDVETVGVSLSAPIRSDVSVTKGADRLKVVGKVAADLEIDCLRCLEPFKHEMRFEFTADFVPPEHFTTDGEHQVSGDDLNVDVIQDDRLDLVGLLKEQVLLNLPESACCRQDCKGLCEKCGENRNLIDCSCKEKEIDPRWAALKNMK